MNRAFVGRKSELRLLRDLRNSSEARFAVVYGRRRVGKSFLISEAYNDCRVYVFEGIENRATSEQIIGFKRQIKRHFPRASLPEENNWYQVLRCLATCVKHQACVVVLDEFQWMANYRSELVSILKLSWDQDLSKASALTLVLCGSVASFMVNKVVRSRALYGRVHQPIHLKPFKLAETGQLLHGRSRAEVLQAQLLVGGVPLYLKLLAAKDSIYLGMQELAFSEHGYLTREFDRIFVSQFGKSDLYRKIIRVLAAHPTGLRRSQLTQAKEIRNGGNLTRHLQDLEVAGLIYSCASFQHGPGARSRLYRLSDPYLRLYLHFIEKALPQIEAGAQSLFIRLTGAPSFSAWMGLACEILCYEHRYELSKIMGFSDVSFTVGPFFRPETAEGPGAQIDLVYDRKDAVMTVCEIKYRDRDIGLSVVEDVKRKISCLPNPRGKTIQRALISKSPPTQSLRAAAYFTHLVRLDSLIDSTK